MYKKVNVVMLPTNEKATAPIFKSNNHLYIGYGEKLEYKNKDNSYQHLYITSDEEIKDGDWCILFDSFGHLFTDSAQQYIPSKGHVLNNGLCKVISSTDTILNLPQPSQEFIQQYIKNYNEGNSITNVKVEYEDYWIKAEYSLDVAYRPVINSDCTINIKPIKDSWSREEVESLIREWASFTVTGRGQWWKPNDLDNWIKENL